MDNTFYIIKQTIGISLISIIAGLAGCVVIFFRNNSGSLQARAVGFLIGVCGILFIVPFLVHVVSVKLGFEISLPVEMFLAFISGLFSQVFIENLIDDPTGTLSKGIALTKRLKAIVFDSERMQKLF